MTLLLPLVLIGPVMMLLAAVLSLASHGPLGWVAAGVFLWAVWRTCRWLFRVGRVWWASTKAPPFY